MTHDDNPQPFALAIHGGAGTIDPAKLTPELEDAYHAGLRAALTAGRDVLAAGGAALDAVTAAVMALEDEPLFNAGRGAVFTANGAQEMDAAIMDGRTRAAGAVAGLFGPRNPILAARAVMERTDHVLLIGDGALDLCRRAGLAMEEAPYFFTQARWDALQAELAFRASGAPDDGNEQRRHGTVGAVARDVHGDVAAATSTGGMTAKAAGRVGDSPLIGAGTYADNETCAISATGHGEHFIRHVVAHEIAARMRWGGQSLFEAADAVVVGQLGPIGGSGGLVAVDREGRVSLPFNCSGMYRGIAKADGPLLTAIHREDFRVSR
jgi:L-asparaginase / beta-aspartyl-peptidase